MGNFAVFRAFCLLGIIRASQQLSITKFSVPSSVQAGENAELACEYSLEGAAQAGLYVKWWWSPLQDADTKIQVYQRIAGSQPQIIHTQTKDLHIEIKEPDTIVITNVQPKNSGTFECEVSNLDEIRQHQKLIVYSSGSGPHVNVSLEEGAEAAPALLVACEAADVAPRPELAITLNGQVLNTSEMVSEPLDGLYSVYANASVPSEADAEVRCELFFDNKDISHPAYIDTLLYSPTAATQTSPPPAPRPADPEPTTDAPATQTSPPPAPRPADPEPTTDAPDDSNRRSGAIWLVLGSLMVTLRLKSIL